MKLIFRDAFSFTSMGGGVLGFLTSRALRTGTMRGLLSNEAGCGTAPTAHACANAVSPWAQGVWGIIEVLVDTVLLCTATALVILVSYSQVEMLGADGVMMALRAYSCVLGEWAAWFLGVAIFCFAYGTVLCWGHYGAESLRALTSEKRWRICYAVIFGGCVTVGSVVAPQSVWGVADFALTGLTTVNLLMLLLMRREIRAETDKCLLPIDKRENP
jgi:AGCS family alanine or glycine:cation symporter